MGSGELQPWNSAEPIQNGSHEAEEGVPLQDKDNKTIIAST